MAEINSGLQSRHLENFGVLNRIITPIHSVYFSNLNRSVRKRVLAIFIATLTTACSSIMPGTQITAATISTPTDYRKIIIEGTPAPMTKGAEVSELHRTSEPQPGDWIACVKSDTTPYIGFFAVFIEDGKVKDFRRCIAIDHCESAMYSPLQSAVSPAKEKDKLHKHNKVDSTSKSPKDAN